MPIEIEKVDGGYLARVSPPHRNGVPWASDGPQTVQALVADLRVRGCHQTDIGDALYRADPAWLDGS
jgi:hypothetical protein